MIHKYKLCSYSFLLTLFCVTLSSAQISDVITREFGKAELFYASVNNQLEISLTRHLQLYGDLDDGMILLPKFTVKGKKAVAPKTVELQFVSYSYKKIFTTDRKLTISINDKILFESITKLGLSKTHKDNAVTEVLIAHIPFEKFSQLVTAKGARVEIGAKSFELSSEQLNELNDMKRCVDEGISVN